LKTKINIHPEEIELDSVLSPQEQSTIHLELHVPDNWNIRLNTYTKQNWFSNLRHKVNYVIQKRDVLDNMQQTFKKKEDYAGFAYRCRRYIKLADYAKTEEKVIKIYERFAPILEVFQASIQSTDFDSIRVDNILTWQLEQSILRNSKRLSSKALFELGDKINDYRKLNNMPTDMKDDTVVNGLRRMRMQYEKYVMLEEHSHSNLGSFRKHFAYSVAAALAMSVSIAIAFKAQSVLNNASVYLFAIFVVGYIFKDRFKEIFRAWMYELMHRGKYQVKTVYADPNLNKGLVTKELFEFQNNPDIKAVAEDFGVTQSTYPMECLSYKCSLKSNKLTGSDTRIRHMSKINIKHILGKAPRSKVMSHWKDKGKIKSSNVKISYILYLVLKVDDSTQRYRLIVTNNKIESHTKL
jgi:hypothetical protein